MKLHVVPNMFCVRSEMAQTSPKFFGATMPAARSPTGRRAAARLRPSEAARAPFAKKRDVLGCAPNILCRTLPLARFPLFRGLDYDRGAWGCSKLGVVSDPSI